MTCSGGTASAEAATLHDPASQVWCKKLLDDGVTATLGPVYEPYLAAFPRPEEFFGMLVQGETLGESYWRSQPFTSWMMTPVGDPLYRPFKNHKVMKSPEAQAAAEGLLALGLLGLAQGAFEVVLAGVLVVRRVVPVDGRRRRGVGGLRHGEGGHGRRGRGEGDTDRRRSKRPGSTGHLSSSPAYRSRGRGMAPIVEESARGIRV